MSTSLYLLDIAIILLFTKLLSIITKKVNMPQVVGALLAGIILGPAALGILQETALIEQISGLGVVVLMFCAGLQTDIKELKKTGPSAFVIAIFGVLIPLGAGYLLARFFHPGGSEREILESLFIGLVLTATSVSITVETLKEMGKLSTRSGNAILGAALIDDILGIVCLTLITSLSDQSVSILLVLAKIVLFFLLSLGVGLLLRRLVQKWMMRSAWDQRRFAVLSLSFCLFYAFVADHFFGVADITGAFIAGLIISDTKRATYITSRCETLSYMLLSPVFFASIGLKVTIDTGAGATMWGFAALLTIVAILTKVLGCGLGAKARGYSGRESLQIGVGMISRGEVALIMANKGLASGLLHPFFMTPVILMVTVTVVITPVLLRLAYTGKKAATPLQELEYSALTEQYEEVEQLDTATQMLLRTHQQIKEQPGPKEKGDSK